MPKVNSEKTIGIPLKEILKSDRIIAIAVTDIDLKADTGVKEMEKAALGILKWQELIKNIRSRIGPQICCIDEKQQDMFFSDARDMWENICYSAKRKGGPARKKEAEQRFAEHWVSMARLECMNCLTKDCPHRDPAYPLRSERIIMDPDGLNIIRRILDLFGNTGEKR